MSIKVSSASANQDGFTVTLSWETYWAARGAGSGELFVSVGHETTRPSYSFSTGGDSQTDSWTVTFPESDAGDIKVWKVSGDDSEVGGSITLPDDGNGDNGGGTTDPSISNLDVTLDGGEMQASVDMDDPDNVLGLNDFLWSLSQNDGGFSDNYRNGPSWTVSGLDPGNYTVTLQLVGDYDSTTASFDIADNGGSNGLTSVSLSDLSVQVEDNEIAATVAIEEDGGEVPGENIEWTLLKGGSVVEESTSAGQFLRTIKSFDNYGPGDYTLEVYASANGVDDFTSTSFSVQDGRSVQIQGVETDGLNVMPTVGVTPEDADVANVYWDLLSGDTRVDDAEGPQPTMVAPQDGDFTVEARVEFSDGVIKSDQSGVSVSQEGNNGDPGNGDQGGIGDEAIIAGAAVAGVGGLALLASSDDGGE